MSVVLVSTLHPGAVWSSGWLPFEASAAHTLELQAEMRAHPERFPDMFRVGNPLNGIEKFFADVNVHWGYVAFSVSSTPSTFLDFPYATMPLAGRPYYVGSPESVELVDAPKNLWDRVLTRGIAPLLKHLPASFPGQWHVRQMDRVNVFAVSSELYEYWEAESATGILDAYDTSTKKFIRQNSVKNIALKIAMGEYPPKQT